MRKTISILLFFFLAFGPALCIATAQTSQSLVVLEKPSSQVIVTFTFHLPVTDYSLFGGESGDQRYYLRVPTSNIPSYQIAPAGASIKVLVDNEKSSGEALVFCIPVLGGTVPRIDRNQSGLTLTFMPAQGFQSNPVFGRTAQAPTRLVPNESTGDPLTSSPLTMSFENGQAPKPTPTPAADNALATANVDLSVPESPAFTVLGLTPETVVRPSSPREFASSLLSGIDRNGNFQSGTALDTTPYLLLAGAGLTLRKYNEAYKLRLASRTQFSFATTKGASEEDKSVRLALGLRMTLWDNGDPRSDKELMDCFDKASTKYYASLIKPDIVLLDMLPADATPDLKMKSIEAWGAYHLREAQANPIRNEENETCRSEARKRNWNKSSWMVAYAPSWISTTGQTKNFKRNGGGVWTSLAYGFEGFPGLQKHSQLIFHARYRSNEQVPDPVNKGKFFGQDSFFMGTRMRVGNENSTASFEGVFVRSRPEGKRFDNSARYSVGLERKIAENLWFALAFGGENGRQDGRNNGFVLTSFRWGFSQKKGTASLAGQ
jgi:hypothetical protein